MVQTKSGQQRGRAWRALGQARTPRGAGECAPPGIERRQGSGRAGAGARRDCRGRHDREPRAMPKQHRRLRRGVGRRPLAPAICGIRRAIAPPETVQFVRYCKAQCAKCPTSKVLTTTYAHSMALDCAFCLDRAFGSVPFVSVLISAQLMLRTARHESTTRQDRAWAKFGR